MERNFTHEDTRLFRISDKREADTHARGRFARLMVWILLGLSLAIFVAAVILLLLVPGAARGSDSSGSDYQIGFILLSYCVLGALIAARHPRNPIGWIFIVMGLGSELHVLAIGYLIYANYRNPNSIHFPLLLFSLLVNPFILQRALGPLGLLLFPDGKLLSPRWRVIAWLPVGLGMIWYFTSTPAPAAGLPEFLFLPIVQPVIPALNTDISSIVGTVTSSIIEVFFVAATIGTVWRLRQARGEQREQLKWFVYSAVLTATITFGLTILGSLPMNRGIETGAPTAGIRLLALLPDLAYVFIPLAAFIAIYKYHLYDIDLIINRTLVYIPLTAILAGLYAASVTLFQRLFIASTGQKSDAAVVMSSLILAAAFTPIKNSLQDRVDRRFKEPRDPLKDLKAFDQQIESMVEVLDSRRTTHRLLDITMSAFKASCGAMYLVRGGDMVLANASEDWKEGCEILRLPLHHEGIQLGVLMLGARSNHKDYSQPEYKILQQTVDHVAEMIWFAQVTAQGIEVGE